jgi:hypothetical protein
MFFVAHCPLNSFVPGTDLHMHGRVLWQLREYIEARHGKGGWNALLKIAGLSDRVYLSRAYPDFEAVALFTAASTMSKQSLPTLLEDFGEFTVPSLLTLYGHVIRPEWRALDVIAHAEQAAHGWSRQNEPGSAPPFLRVRRLAPGKLLLIYNSPRRLCAFAVGVGIGLGKHFDQRVVARHRLCMHDGADHCEITFEVC